MTYVKVSLIDNEGFTSCFDASSDDIRLMRDKAVKFLDSMLGLSSAYRIRLSSYTDVEGAKIPAIKAIRTVTNLGLKEAKDVVDKLQESKAAIVTLDILYTKEESMKAKPFLTPYFAVEVIDATP
jgi:hypothetical protein